MIVLRGTRRVFIRWSAGFGLAVVGGGLIYRVFKEVTVTSLRSAGRFAVLSEGAEEILRALIPVLLEGALPDEPRARKKAVEDLIVAVDESYRPMSLRDRLPIVSFYAWLGQPEVYRPLMIPNRWRDASLDEVREFMRVAELESRDRLSLRIQRLYRLINELWYGQDASWEKIGYRAGDRAAE